jgi:hypothetical protein
MVHGTQVFVMTSTTKLSVVVSQTLHSERDKQSRQWGMVQSLHYLLGELILIKVLPFGSQYSQSPEGDTEYEAVKLQS